MSVFECASGEWVFCIPGGACPYKHVELCICVFFWEAINERGRAHISVCLAGSGRGFQLCISVDRSTQKCVHCVSTFMSDSHVYVGISVGVCIGVRVSMCVSMEVRYVQIYVGGVDIFISE